MQKGIVINLLDQEIRHVRARDEPASPVARIDLRAIGIRPIGQDHGTHDHPVELAPTDDPFLHVLVGIDAPQWQMKRHVMKNCRPYAHCKRTSLPDAKRSRWQQKGRR